jgi:hypothetical protein
MFVIEKNQPLLGNYRVKRSVYIVDRLFEGDQLRGGPESAVSIRHMRASLPPPANRGHAAGPGQLGGAGGGGAGKGSPALEPHYLPPKKEARLTARRDPNDQRVGRDRCVNVLVGLRSL